MRSRSGSRQRTEASGGVDGGRLAIRLWDLLDAIHEIADDEEEARATLAAILREGRVHIEPSGPWLAFVREVSVAA
jgi:hypothetical protein